MIPAAKSIETGCRSARIKMTEMTEIEERLDVPERTASQRSSAKAPSLQKGEEKWRAPGGSSHGITHGKAGGLRRRGEGIA